MSEAFLPGFNYLAQAQPSGTSPARAALLASLLGLLGAWAWLGTERDLIDENRAQQQALKVELKKAELSLSQADEQARRAQARRDEGRQLQSWQAVRLQALDGLEALALTPGPRLSQLHFDGQTFIVQGRMPSRQLQSWSELVSARLMGWGDGQLLHLENAPQASAAEPVRFVLRWSVPQAKVAP